MLNATFSVIFKHCALIDFCNRVVQKEIQFLWKKSEELGNEHDAIRKSMSRNFCQHLVNGRLLKRGQGHSHFFSWKVSKVIVFETTEKVSILNFYHFLVQKIGFPHSWKSPKISHLNFSFWHFPSIFVLLSSNTVWLQEFFNFEIFHVFLSF